MKTKTSIKYPERPPQALELREAATVPGVGLCIPVRAAKAKFSALLELVSSGQEVTITSDGKPKAVLSPAGRPKAQKLFQGMGDYLKSQPVHRGPDATEIVREDRDGRGW